MVQSRKRLILGLLVLVLLLGAAYAWTSISRPGRWKQGYSQIEKGDTEQRVVEILGKPTKVEDCYRPRYSGNDELWQKCAKEYWYVGFFEEWVYVIGHDGSVVSKWHSVSP